MKLKRKKYYTGTSRDKRERAVYYIKNDLPGKVESYINNRILFVEDLKKSDIREDFDIYFDLMQYFLHCRPTIYQVNTSMDEMVEHYNNRFPMINGWGYKIIKPSTNLVYNNIAPHRKIFTNHIYRLAKFLDLYMFGSFLLNTPRYCRTPMYGFDAFRSCGNILTKKNSRICEQCSKYTITERRDARINEMLALPTRDNFIQRAPEIALLLSI